MPRRPRSCPGGFVYHVLNRAAGRLRLFKTDKDYLAFERIMLEAHSLHPIKVFDYCLMPNHWHFVVRPDDDDQVTTFFRWLAHTHAMRWHVAKGAVGIGPLYQGRFKSFPIENDDDSLLTVLRYIDRNPLRAKLVKRSAIDWRWCAAHVRANSIEPIGSILAPWPVDEPRDWRRYVDDPQTPAEQDAVRMSIRRSRPFGSARWTARTAKNLDLDWTMRPPRPPEPKRATSPLIDRPL